MSNRLYIRQKVFKILDHYEIRDEQGDPVYLVDQKLRLIGFAVKVRYANGETAFTLEKDLLTLLRSRYRLHFANGSEIVLRRQLRLFRKNLDILPADLNLSVQGSLLNHDYELLRGNDVIATIHKAWISWGDVYEIEIFDPSVQDLCVGIMIAIDAILDAEKHQNAEPTNDD